MRKPTLGLVALAISFYLASFGPAIAADAATIPPASSAQATSHAPRDPVAWTQKRLDSLNKKLNLTSAQQSAWSNYSAAILKLAQERTQERAQWKAERSQAAEMSAPAKLERFAARMRAGANRLDKLAADTKAFYTVLSSEQKTIFELFAESGLRQNLSRRHDFRR